MINSLKILEFVRICMEKQQNVTGWQELFFSYKSTNLSNFRQLLQSLLLKYMAENLQVT